MALHGSATQFRDAELQEIAMDRVRNQQVGTAVEPLEDRRMYSVSQIGGTVFVEGSNVKETVVVSEFLSNSELSLGERLLKITETRDRPLGLPPITRTTVLRAATVTRLRVNAFGGNDVIRLNTSKPADVYGGAGS